MSGAGAFVRQLGWEIRKLATRPRTFLGFAACLAFEIALVVLYRTTALDDLVAERYWRVPAELAASARSGLTLATHVTAETMAAIASLFLALVAGDMVATEAEERTLHMILARPVARGSVLIQKVLAIALYTLLLCLFIGTTSLALGLLAEGPGALVVVSAPQSVIGVHDFAPGLRRYALGIAMLGPCWLSFSLLALLLSCCRMKAGAATVVALALLLTDHALRIQPGFAAFATYSFTTRLLTWRQAFGYDVAWLRIERNLTQLFVLDLALIAAAWWTLRRRELSP